MDTTCTPGEIQCTQEVVDSLQGSHFQFRYTNAVALNYLNDICLIQILLIFMLIRITDAGGKLKSKAKAIWSHIF